MFRRNWKSPLSPSEVHRGWVFFLLYLFVFPRLNAWAQQRWLGSGELLLAEANVFYYTLLFVLSLLVFWNFWRGDFMDLLDWLPENLMGLAAGAVFTLVVGSILKLIPLPQEDLVPQQYAAEYLAAPLPTLILVLLLIPVVEEFLFRGLLFGSLRQYSLPLAYALSIPLYALSCVWQYAIALQEPSYLLVALRYLPLSAALCACYDNGGSIWSCVLLHGCMDALTLFTALP